MEFIKTNINKTSRNGVINYFNGNLNQYIGSGSGGGTSVGGSYLPAINNGDGTYRVDINKVLFSGNIVADGEVCAYGVGSGDTSGSSVTIYDGLDSTAIDVALSANQGRVLKGLIDQINEKENITSLVNLSDVSINNLQDKQTLVYDANISKWVNEVAAVKVTWDTLEGKPELLTNENINNWNAQSHEHSNKTTLDKITEENLTNWNNKLDKSIWDKAFYFDSNENLKVKLNLIGEKEVSAYGLGDGGGSGAITIIDGLNSYATDAALSANQGRVLKEMINSKPSVSSWDDITDKPTWIGDTKPNYQWNEILNKPDTYTPSEHTHMYASSSSAGGAATSANKVNSTLTFSGYQSKSFNGSSNVNVTIPNNTNQLTNGAGFITASSSIYGNAATATKLKNSVNLWGQSFDGSTDITGDLYSLGQINCSNTMQINGSNYSGSYPRVLFHIPDVAWAQLFLRLGQLQLRDGGSQDGNWYPMATGEFTTNGNSIATGSFISHLTDRWPHTWRIFHNPDNCAFRANQISLMNEGETRPILGWIDSIDGVGYQTRYAIGTIRPRKYDWGSMLISVSASDDGSVNGTHIQLDGGGTISLVAYSTVVNNNLTAKGEITAYSDERLKTDIKPLKNRGYINPITYKKDGKECIGFSAQEVQKLYPELVTEDNTEEKYLSVNYQQYVAVLQAQIIEQNKRINDLEEKINLLLNTK